MCRLCHRSTAINLVARYAPISKRHGQDSRQALSSQVKGIFTGTKRLGHCSGERPGLATFMAGRLASRYRLIKTMPVAITTAAATRRLPNDSPNARTPMTAAKTTLVSRIAATSASGARVWAHSTIP